MAPAAQMETGNCELGTNLHTIYDYQITLNYSFCLNWNSWNRRSLHIFWVTWALIMTPWVICVLNKPCLFDIDAPYITTFPSRKGIIVLMNLVEYISNTLLLKHRDRLMPGSWHCWMDIVNEHRSIEPFQFEWDYALGNVVWNLILWEKMLSFNFVWTVSSKPKTIELILNIRKYLNDSNHNHKQVKINFFCSLRNHHKNQR